MTIKWKHTSTSANENKRPFQAHSERMTAFYKAHPAAVLTNGSRTITSDILETTKLFLLQKPLLETGDALPHKSVMEQWLFMPLPSINICGHRLN